MLPLVPVTSFEGLVWPPLPGSPAREMLAILEQLDRSQWWTPAQLRERQLAQVAPLLSHAAESVPFYRDRLREAGIRAGQPVTPETWERIPILSRKEIRPAGAALHSTRLPPEHGTARPVESSRVSAMPITVMMSTVAHLMWRAFSLRGFLWSGLDPALKLARIRRDRAQTTPGIDGRSGGNWGDPIGFAFATGAAVTLEKGLDVASRVRFLLDQQPGVLNARPSILKGILEEFRKEELKLPSIRGVQTYGEVLAPGVRELCREVWGAPIYDTYQTKHLGYLALQCPEHEHYHVQAESALVEILDENGRPCAPGETGRVVATPLHNFAMPLIRLEVGDVAELGAPCACGRGLPVITRFVGHRRNMVRLPDGSRRLPANLNEAFAGVVAAGQFQVVQRALDDVDVCLAGPKRLEPGEEQRLCEGVRARLGHPFPVRVSYVDAVRRIRGRVEEFLCEVA